MYLLKLCVGVVWVGVEYGDAWTELGLCLDCRAPHRGQAYLTPNPSCSTPPPPFPSQLRALKERLAAGDSDEVHSRWRLAIPTDAMLVASRHAGVKRHQSRHGAEDWGGGAAATCHPYTTCIKREKKKLLDTHEKLFQLHNAWLLLMEYNKQVGGGDKKWVRRTKPLAGFCDMSSPGKKKLRKITKHRSRFKALLKASKPGL